jgi:hypothetical protein
MFTNCGVFLKDRHHCEVAASCRTPAMTMPRIRLRMCGIIPVSILQIETLYYLVENETSAHMTGLEVM